VAEIKYEVKGSTRHFSLWSEVYDPILKVNHLVTEHVGKENQNGNTPVTLRVFIDQKAFNTISKATFKTPYSWEKQDKQKMDPKLVQTIDIWLKEREKLLGDKIADNSIKISSLKLNTYHSEEVVAQKQGKQWALVGDAAFGVPYFRSLNNGLLCGTELAKQVNAFLNNERVEVKTSFLGLSWSKKTSALQGYSNYVHELAKYENWIAKLKTQGLNLLGLQLATAKTLLGIGIVGNQEDASIPNRAMILGLTAMAGACLYSAMKTSQDSEKQKLNTVKNKQGARVKLS
ncbi:MAG TPA: hypothetical protein PLD88_00110, partial [Candidatus Berkiella sp.]|nr:hypothetical protein [Candidatus Berkiella sp.]